MINESHGNLWFNEDTKGALMATYVVLMLKFKFNEMANLRITKYSTLHKLMSITVCVKTQYV